MDYSTTKENCDICKEHRFVFWDYNELDGRRLGRICDPCKAMLLGSQYHLATLEAAVKYIQEHFSAPYELVDLKVSN